MSTWACVATGASLTAEDVQLLEGRVRILAVNDAYRIAPFADAVYAADHAWWNIHYPRVRSDFTGRMYSIETGDQHNPRIIAQLYPGVRLFRWEKNKELRNQGLSRTPGYVRLGSLSGYQAINIAYLWGATAILLLGYDMQRTGGKTHFFGDHPRGLANGTNYGEKVKYFQTIRPADYGIQVINCTRATALSCFPRLPLERALELYA